MPTTANPYPLSQTMACRQAGNMDGFVREIVAEMRSRVFRIYSEQEIASGADLDGIRQLMHDQLRDIMVKRLEADRDRIAEQLLETYAQEDEEKFIDAVVAQVNTIMQSWADEFMVGFDRFIELQKKHRR